VTSKWAYGVVDDILQESLDKLQLKYLDLYLIHTPLSIVNGDYEGPWRRFEEAREKGLVRSIGVSNFTIEDLDKLAKVARVKPAVNQINLHPYNYSSNIKLLEYHRQHGIVTEAYGSLAPITTFPGGPVDAALDKPAQRLRISRAQVIFLWLRAKGIVIVTTSSKKERLEEYIQAGDLPPLTLEEVAAIDVAGADGPPLSLASFGSKEGLCAVMRKPWWRLAMFLFLLGLWLIYRGNISRFMPSLACARK